MENKRQIERTREVELDNDRLKQENLFLSQTRDADISKLKNYIGELENTVNSQREVQKELMQSKSDQQRYIDSNLSKIKAENEDLKR